MRFLVLSFFLLNISLFAQDNAHKEWVRANYTKHEYRVPMRDGIELFTAVYVPNWSTKEKWPFILFRTPYSVGPYGLDKYRSQLGSNPDLDRSGFIFVFQDVRGKFMSDGHYLNMRPHRGKPKGKKAWTNEATDTYDTIDWLLKNVKPNNERVAQWGISYPGFYTAAGMIDSHPALKLASPQAPIADWFWDDMHHNGAFNLNLAFNFFSSFGQKPGKRFQNWPKGVDHVTSDGYEFFMRLGPLSNVNEKYFKGDIDFWNKLAEHPNYDDFWQSRNILPHLKNINCAVLTVGGFYDAEDLYGPLKIYENVERNNPNITNTIVMGAWSHGAWARRDARYLGDADFGTDTSMWYKKHVEMPTFLHYLKDGPKPNLPEAIVYESGSNRWRQFEQWPPEAAVEKTLYPGEKESLAFEPSAKGGHDEYISDPNKPIPFTTTVTTRWGREFMAEDQRFAARRPDVLTYTTDVLEEDLTLAGPIEAELWVSTDQGDADFMVKIIDVYPPDEPARKVDGKTIPMSDAQIMVRYEMFRGRFRESFEHPKPFKANQPTKVKIEVQDVMHTFQRGHRLMIQVQSSYFPFFDRNPQKWVDNIFEAKEEDFVKANHKLYRNKNHQTKFKVSVLPSK